MNRQEIDKLLKLNPFRAKLLLSIIMFELGLIAFIPSYTNFVSAVDKRLDENARQSRPPMELVLAQTRTVAEEKNLLRTYQTPEELRPFTEDQEKQLERGSFAISVPLPKELQNNPGWVKNNRATAWLAAKDSSSIYLVTAKHEFEKELGHPEKGYFPAGSIEISRPNIDPIKMRSDKVKWLEVGTKDISVIRVWLADQDLKKIKDDDILKFTEQKTFTPGEKVINVSFPGDFKTPEGLLTGVTILTVESQTADYLFLNGVNGPGSSGSATATTGAGGKIIVVSIHTANLDTKTASKRNFFDRSSPFTTLEHTLSGLSQIINQLKSVKP